VRYHRSGGTALELVHAEEFVHGRLETRLKLLGELLLLHGGSEEFGASAAKVIQLTAKAHH
jgi:hypothetical protein